MTERWWDAAPLANEEDRWWETAPLASDEPEELPEPRPAPPVVSERPAPDEAITTDPEAYLLTAREQRLPDAELEALRAAQRERLAAAEDKSSALGDTEAGVLQAQTLEGGLAINRAGRRIERAERAMESGPVATDPEAYLVTAVDKPEEEIAKGVQTIMDYAPGLMDLMRRSSEIPMNPAAQAFGDPEGDTTKQQLTLMWDAFASDPTGVARTFALRSLPASVPTIIAGMAGQAVAGPGGAAAMAALVGGSTEVGAYIAGELTGAMANDGVDVDDRAAVQKWAMNNMPEVLEIIGKGRIRGTVIGAGSAVGMGATGAIARGVGQGSFGARAGGAALGVPVEGITEGAAEGLAQVAAGDELNLGEIGAEVVGGGAIGAAQTAGQIGVESRRDTSPGARLGDALERLVDGSQPAGNAAQIAIDRLRTPQTPGETRYVRPFAPGQQVTIDDAADPMNGQRVTVAEDQSDVPLGMTRVVRLTAAKAQWATASLWSSQRSRTRRRCGPKPRQRWPSLTRRSRRQRRRAQPPKSRSR
jgi:hypothetical protein